MSHEYPRIVGRVRDPSLPRSVGTGGGIRRRAQSEPRNHIRKEVRFADGSRPRHAGSSVGIVTPSLSSSTPTKLPPFSSFTDLAKREGRPRVSFDDASRISPHASSDSEARQTSRRARSQEARSEQPAEKRRKAGHRWFSIFERIPKHRWQSLGLL